MRGTNRLEHLALLALMPATRPELMRATNKPRSTITELIRVMEKRGLIYMSGLKYGYQNAELEVFDVRPKTMPITFRPRHATTILQGMIDPDFISAQRKIHAHLKIVLAGPKALWFSSLIKAVA